jgi:hypothetical protein
LTDAAASTPTDISAFACASCSPPSCRCRSARCRLAAGHVRRSRSRVSRHALAVTGTLDLAAAGTPGPRPPRRAHPAGLPGCARRTRPVPGTLRPGWPSGADDRPRGRGLRHAAHGNWARERVCRLARRAVTGRAPSVRRCQRRCATWRDHRWARDGSCLLTPCRGRVAYPDRARHGRARPRHDRLHGDPPGPAIAPDRGRARRARASTAVTWRCGRRDLRPGTRCPDATSSWRCGGGRRRELARSGSGECGRLVPSARCASRPPGWRRIGEGPPPAVGDGVRLGDLRLHSGTQRTVLSADLGTRRAHR